MSTNFISQRTTEMRHRVSDFLTGNLDNPKLGWPRISPTPRPRSRKAPSASSTVGLKVLVGGDLTLELPVEVEATQSQLLASLRSGCGDRKFRWRMSKAQVGGFVARAARVAAVLGAEVTVCAAVPTPMPTQFARFFEEHSICQRFITGLPGSCPVTVVFRCTDGSVPIRRRSVVSAAGLNWPSSAERAFDLILADPCHLPRRNLNTRHLHRCFTRGEQRLVGGLRIDHQWALADLAPTHDERVWTFVRHRDACLLAKRIAANGADPVGGQDEDCLARNLQDRCRIAKPVLQLGPRGAVLMNSVPCPYHVHTCPLDPAGAIGSGDMLMTVTALSSASGADDRTSLRRGVAAATGHTAGLELPRKLEELDAA